MDNADRLAGPLLRGDFASATSRAAAVHRENSKPAKPRVARTAAPPPPAQATPPQPAAEVAAKPEPAPVNVAALPAADGAAAASRSTTLREQVAAATELAEQVTAASAAPAPHREAVDAEAFASAFVAEPGDNRVALLLTRPEIKSVSDLAGKDIAIGDQQAASSTAIRAAIASAGAAEVKLNEGSTKAIDRLVGGEVQAAVLTLVSAEAAAWFPDVPGYRVFRIPLSSGASR